MKQPTTKMPKPAAREMPVSEFLILADGRILAHNLTPVMADVLAELNPADTAMSRRAALKKI
jgi:hypothetical protein